VGVCEEVNVPDAILAFPLGSILGGYGLIPLACPVRKPEEASDIFSRTMNVLKRQ
jgi:hypothetical protein